MEQTKELEQLRSLPASRQSIALFAERIINALNEGEVNALDVLRNFKGFEKLHEAVKAELDKKAVAEASVYSSKEEITTYSGVKFEVCEFGTKYAYDKCGDSVWAELKAKAVEANAALKEREEFLKALKSPVEVVDESTGEIVKIYPPLKTSTTGVKTTFL